MNEETEKYYAASKLGVKAVGSVFKSIAVPVKAEVMHMLAQLRKNESIDRDRLELILKGYIGSLDLITAIIE